MAKYVLGLDLGPTSIGWACIKVKGKNESGILGAGSRVFPEGVDRSTKGEEISKNKERQEARSARRVKSRRSGRKRRLVALLREAGFFPRDGKTMESLFSEQDPYEIRARALNEKLALEQIGRAFFHINQRRGFKSNRKSGDKKESGPVLKSISELQEKIAQSGARTLGEYLFQQGANKAKREQGEIRLRNRYTLRAMYEEEFEAIWEAQKALNPKRYPDKLKKQIHEAIFFQLPLKPKDHLIGRCEFEPDEPRCPRADWQAQQFRILKEVNNLAIVNRGGDKKFLSERQRKVLIDELSVKKQMAFASMRKKFDLLESQLFNLEEGKRKYLLGNSLEFAMLKAFGIKAWRAWDEDQRNALRRHVVEVEDPEELREILEKECELDEKGMDVLIHADLPKGYLHLSKKAIGKLLPYLEKGANEHDAVMAVYPDHEKEKRHHNPVLPLPPDLRNPIVQRGLVEVRKVVNAIVRKYGMPERIRVELAREMHGNKGRREESIIKMRKAQKQNEEANQTLREEHKIDRPSRDDRIRYRLWIEQEGLCPYTGKAIPQSKLFSPDVEVDHILPFSRSLDDSYVNKTVCYAKANRDKGNLTPAEWLGRIPAKLERTIQLVNSFEKMPYWKRTRFSQKEVKIEKCIERQLNDTRYISREVTSYLKQLFPVEQQKKHLVVQVSRGKLTSDLRHHWGLNQILNPLVPDLKNRDDHRHHAVDAVVIALSTSAHVQAFARAYKGYKNVDSLQPPWENFRGDVATVINAINVSFRVRRKVSGALHEETSYGHIAGDRFAYRVPLTALSGAMVKDIRDPIIRGLVVKRCADKGVDPAQVGSKKLPATLFSQDEPLRMKSGVIVKKVRIQKTLGPNRIAFLDATGKPFRYAKLGSNHHIEIYETKDKKGKPKFAGDVVTTLEAHRRVKDDEPVIRRDHGPGTRFVMSLSINECVMAKLDDGKHHLYRVQKIWATDKDRIVQIRPITYAGIASENMKYPLVLFAVPNSLVKKYGAFKVNVSPLGEINVAHD